VTRRRPRPVPLDRHHLDASSPPAPDSMLDEIGRDRILETEPVPGAVEAIGKKLAALLRTPPKG
jgi:hypothetical protein